MNAPAAGRRAALMRSGVPISLLGGAATGGSMFLLSILVARSLSQAQFANFVFCLALSQLWFIPTLSGLELAGPRHLAAQPSPHRAAAAGSVVAMSLGLGGTVAVLTLPAAFWIADITNSPTALVYGAMYFGVATGLRAVLERLLASIGHIAAVARVKLFESSIIVIGALAVLSMAASYGWTGPIIVVDGAATVAVLIYAGRLYRSLGRLTFRRDNLREIWSFARHAAPSTLFAVVLMYVDKFALRIEAQDETYALYSAYFAGSLIIAVQAVFVLQNLVLPASVRSASSASVRSRMVRAVPVMIAVLPIAFLSSLVLVLALLGPAYEFELGYALLFAAWATAYTCNVLGVTAIVGRSTPAMKRESHVLATRSILGLGVLFGLGVTGNLTIATVAIVMLSLELLESLNVALMTRRYLRDPHEAPGPGSSVDV